MSTGAHWQGARFGSHKVGHEDVLAERRVTVDQLGASRVVLVYPDQSIETASSSDWQIYL